MLQIGDSAPEFTVRDGTGRGQTALTDYAGKRVVIAFYALAFTGG